VAQVNLTAVSGYCALASSPGDARRFATRTRPGGVWACPGGFAAVSRSLLMLTPVRSMRPTATWWQLQAAQRNC